MKLFKKPTPQQKRAKTIKRKKAVKTREEKQERNLAKLKHIRENQEVKAQIEKAKAEKVAYRTERLHQLPIVGKRVFGTSTTNNRPATTPRKHRHTKILGRGSGWNL